jgi:hypothetical protein
VIAQRRIAGSPDSHTGEIAARQVVRQCESVGTADFNLAFAGDIPQRDAVDEAGILGVGVTEPDGHVHAVVDGERAHARSDGRVVERGLANP